MSMVVLTVDQDGSRDADDQVPHALSALSHVRARLAFERTVGDELQGVLDDPPTVAAALEPLIRAGAWNIGVGIGSVETPLPDHARAGRGAAYLRAREAVSAAKSSPWRIRVAGADDAGRALESALWLWAALLSRRTPGGWQVADLVDQGLTYEETAARIGVSRSAVSQRAAAAGIAEGRRARELVEHLVRAALAAA